MATLIDDSGTTRFEGTITGAGTTPVTCYLQATSTDIHPATSIPLLWDRLKDNAFDFNTLTAIPAGLGLVFLFNGTNADITATEAGTWGFSLQLAFVQDATWTGFLSLDQNTGMEQDGTPNAPNPRITVSEVVTYPAGAIFTPRVLTDTASTANPLDASAGLTIVRLG